MEKAHPHMRGENGYGTGSGYQYKGSPPHAWGKSWYVNWINSLIRLTPTCVGKIKVVHMIRLCYGAHPHMRGENSMTE